MQMKSSLRILFAFVFAFGSPNSKLRFHHSKERSHMISSIFAKMSYAAVEDVFGKLGSLDSFTKGQLRFLSAQLRWQVTLKCGKKLTSYSVYCMFTFIFGQKQLDLHVCNQILRNAQKKGHLQILAH